MIYGVGGRQGLDPELLWVWYRLAAAAPIRALAWKLPYAVGAALKKKKDQKKKALGQETYSDSTIQLRDVG